MNTFGVFITTILFVFAIGAIGLWAGISGTRELRRRAEAEKAQAAKS